MQKGVFWTRYHNYHIMQKRIIECVPNFSEGRNMEVIKQITDAIEGVKGVKLLDVDPGEATNRTVVTFVGEPQAVADAAVASIKRATELIDMRNHKGAHPRMGACDVCPLIPVSGITMEECAELARALAKRIAEELGVPTYCYEAAAFKPERKNLAVCREGEWEGLPDKMATPEKQPDFGARPYDDGIARTGATAVGARDFLVAVNYNLNTTSTRRANAIAFDVREKGRPMREGNPIVGKIIKDENGEPVMKPGTLKACKAIGWFIDEYGIAQVSMNMTDLSVTPLHVAFDEVCRAADARGVRLPVRLRGVVAADRQHVVEEVRLIPDSVTVFATHQYTDTMTAVYTPYVRYEELADSVRQELPLGSGEWGVRYEPSAVLLSARVSPYVSKSVQVPVEGYMFPYGQQLKTFPSKVKVTFRVSLDDFREVSEQDFRILVRHSQIHDNASGKVALMLDEMPENVTDVVIEPVEVDYLIEMNTPGLRF